MTYEEISQDLNKIIAKTRLVMLSDIKDTLKKYRAEGQKEIDVNEFLVFIQEAIDKAQEEIYGKL